MRSQLRAVAVAFFLILILVTSTLDAAPRRRAVQLPEVKSSEQLIDEALAAGQIDQETAIVYRVLASFDDPRLPQQYRGNAPIEAVDNFATADAMFRYDSLSPQAQEVVAPFLVPPFSEGSWHELRGENAVQAKAPSLCGPTNSDWSSILAPSRLVRIWWHKDNPGDAAVAATLTGVADRALLMFRVLLDRETLPDHGADWPCRGGDDAIDVALVDTLSRVTPYFPGTSRVPSFVLLERNPKDGVEMTLVHELFHVFQYTYPVQEFGLHVNYKWMMEATATWAQDYYSRAGNSGREHRAAPHFLNEPEKSLDHENDKHEYGAYLFFFYLTRQYGDGIIKSIWEATASNDALRAVDSTIPGGFQERWPEFAAYNWNRGPVNYYEQWDELTLQAKSTGATLLPGGLPEDYPTLTVDLPHLSATYKHFIFNDNVRSVAFLNGLTYRVKIEPTPPLGPIEFGNQFRWSELSEEARRGASVQAVIKKGGEWQQPEVWTNEPYKSFCRADSNEKIEEIVLIFANSDLDTSRRITPAEIPPALVVTNIGCEWEGKLTFDLSDQLEVALGNLVVTYDVAWKRLDPGGVIQHFLGYPYDITGGAKFTVSGSVGPCTLEGGGDLPIREIVQFTYNFAPQGSSTHRRAYFQFNIPQLIEYAVRCPGAPPSPVQVIHGTYFPRFDETLPIDAGGMIKGQRPDIDGRWEWDLKPVD